MSRSQIPASIIAQRGKTITLMDGSTATVVYTFSSLMVVEDDFGSIVGALAEINGGMTGRTFNAVARLAAAGLEHETTADGAALSDVDMIRGLLDPMRFDEYAKAIGEAIDTAFPAATEGSGEGDADPQMDSPGASGGTSPA